MDNADWDVAIRELTAASDQVATRARCLGVGPELARWRADDDLGGLSVADGLDQARGDLERLIAGGAM